MITPINLAIFALVCGGLMKFFWQMGLENKVDIPSFLVIDALFMFLFTLVTYFILKQPFVLSNRMSIAAALGGVFGGAAMTAVAYAIKSGGQGSVIFPIISLETVVVVILAFIVFREPVTITKLVGLGLGITSIFVLSR
ncbi:MAG: EamA family transporter [Anaerolineales bacterium]|jgi:uncharacterized membrane protein|nr:EamA family transporter [Anaerolineales bacterium]|tara:strand:+ start:409 stop:825 length:417 start_codon:yes stop_codon:yes gene_type:complete